jgi:hypothetical protein
VLGLEARALPSIKPTLHGEIIHKGFSREATTKLTKKLKRGEGVTFVKGNPIERERVMNVLIKHAECIFEWSSRYGLYTKPVAEIPTNGEIISIDPFQINKIQWDALQTILNEYIERGVVEQSESSWKAPAFLIKKQHGPEGPSAFKIWRVVKDYHQLNITIRDEVLDSPSVSELKDIVGCNNKYYCSIYLRHGYHHIPLKASNRERTTFSTGRLAGKLQYQVLPYG